MKRSNLIEEKILKSDPFSEMVLAASGVLLFLPLLLLLVLAVAH